MNEPSEKSLLARIRTWFNSFFDYLENRKKEVAPPTDIETAATVPLVEVAPSVALDSDVLDREHLDRIKAEVLEMQAKIAEMEAQNVPIIDQHPMRRALVSQEEKLMRLLNGQRVKLEAEIAKHSPFAVSGVPIAPDGDLVSGPLPPRVVQRYAGPVPQSVFEDAQMLNEANIAGLSPGQRSKIGKMKRQTLRDWSKGHYNLIEELVNNWTTAVNSRRQYVSLSDEMRRFYMCDRILEIIVGDVFNPDLQGKIVKLTSEDQAKDKALEVLQDNFDLDVHLMSIGVDAVNFGEWSTRIEAIEGQGVVGLDEGSVNQIGICAFYDQGYPSGYMVMLQNTTDFQIWPASSYAHFALGEGKLRIKLEEHFFGNGGQPGLQFDRDKLDKDMHYKLPEYIRMGKPLFWAVVDKMRILQILEQLIPAMKLAQITMSKLVSVRVPTNMPFDDVADLLEEYEELLNVQSGVDTSQQQVTLAEIMTAAGHIKLVPQFMDGKGALDSLNVREDQSVDDILRAQNEIRQSILSSIGIPFGTVYGPAAGITENSGNRSVELRQNSMYTRKLAMIQRAFTNYLRQIGMIHLSNSGFDDVKPADVEVKFLNTMIDVAAIEKAEMDDAMQEMVGRQIQFLKDAFGEEFVQRLMQDNAHLDGIQDWLAASFDKLTHGIHIFDSTEDKDGGPSKGDLRGAFVDKVKDNLHDRITQRLLNPDMNYVNTAAQKMQLDAEATNGNGKKDQVVNHVIDQFAQMVKDRLEKTAKDDDPEEVKQVRHAVISSITDAFVDRIAQR